jgi:hypothetical protein
MEEIRATQAKHAAEGVKLGSEARSYLKRPKRAGVAQLDQQLMQQQFAVVRVLCAAEPHAHRRQIERLVGADRIHVRLTRHYPRNVTAK